MTPSVFARIGSLSAAWAPDLLSLARVIFGFLVLRHGMEQVLAYPEASGAAVTSYEGLLGLASLPGGLLLMLGLFTRPVGLVLAVLYGLFWFVGPLQTSLTLDGYIFGARGNGDETLLNCFFFLYLSAAGGAPGAWTGAAIRTARRLPIPDGRRTRWGSCASRRAFSSSITGSRSGSGSAAGAGIST